MAGDLAGHDRNVDILMANLRYSGADNHALGCWTPDRIAELEAKATSDVWPPFVKSCARGQLAAKDGNIESAMDELRQTLRMNWPIFPENNHLFSHVFQLALSTLDCEVISHFLNLKFAREGLFRVILSDEFEDCALNRVVIDRLGRCSVTFNPRIIGAGMAEYYTSHWLGSMPLWARCLQGPHWIHGSVIMNYGDYGVRPGVAFCANSDKFVLVPDNYFMGSRGYSDLRQKFASARPAWDSRSELAFWRGATSGQASRMDWRTLPRVRLAELSRDHPDIIDAGISHMAGFKQHEEDVRAMGFLKGRVPPEAFLAYKYQIDIDGYSNSWPGLFQKLLTGGAVLKVSSAQGYSQWYYGRLRPWVNFVPVAPDMSDLVEKIKWLKNHDDVANTIGTAGLELALSLNYESELDVASALLRASFGKT